MKILLLGGYGVFGGRLAELIADIPDLEVLICGRSLAKAEALCAKLSGSATFTPVELDRADIHTALNQHTPDILVDASGPFQNYGRDPYAVVKACLEACVNYLDFADAADFVFGIRQFDQAAKNAGVFVLSGVSSFPVLTAAVLRHLGQDMTIQSVNGGIAPSPYAGIGLNVMRAVVSYAGGTVKLTRNGRPFEAKGLTESRRYTIAPPGLMPLTNLRFSLVDVPDLQVLPAEIPSIQDIWMGAGPVPESLHRVLNGLAKTRAALRLPSFEALSPLFYRILNLMKFGEHRGGMYVEVRGVRDGQPVTKSWHLLAEGDDGPYIPSMAIEAVLRKCLDGHRPESGARAATSALNLADYEALFERRTIYTGVRNEPHPADPIYKQILGPAFDSLPSQLQALHSLNRKSVWRGDARVIRGRNLLAKLIAKIIGFPPESAVTPVSVTFTPDETGEHWQRNFGGRTFSSYQSVGTGRNAHLLTERFGLISVALAVVVEDGKLYLVPRRWNLMGLPLPRIFLPKGDSFEAEIDGTFNFDVTIKTPLTGLIVAYRGWLKPDLFQA